jgi:Dolichyl-phosphate-mannose-protein mannosyltransferase
VKSETRWAIAVFLSVFLLHSASPIAASTDSRWSMMLVESMLDRHDVNLDEFLPQIQADHYYAVECVTPQGETITSDIRDCSGGHLYSWYPIGGPLMAAPVFAALRLGMRLFQPALRPLSNERFVHPLIGSFLRGEMIRAHAIVEVVIASFFVALTAVLLYFLARRDLDPARSAAIAWIFAFATSAWSTASRALFQHGPSMLILVATAWILVKAKDRPNLIPLAGLLAAFSYVVRPTNALFFAIVTIFVLIHHTKYFVRYVLCAIPVFAALAAFNLSVYGTLQPSYYSMRPPMPGTLEALRLVGAALAGNLISPGRGLFIYSSIFLFSIWGMILAWRAKWSWPLSAYWIALIVLHWITISLFVNFWWGGHSYGPRFFTDMTPFLTLFLIPVIKVRRLRAVFAVLLLASVYFHARGALTVGPHEWSVDPVEIDQHPERIWDWTDPPFLRPARGRHPG